MKSVVPDEKGKPFFLVNPEDALKLLNYHQERLRDLCARASSYQRNRPVRGPIKPAYVAGPPVPGQSPYPIYPVPPAPVIQSRLPAPTATRTERDSESKVEEGRASTSQWQDDEPSINSDRDLGDDEGMSADSKDSEDGPSTSRRKAGSPYYTFSLETMSLACKQEFRDFADFYGREYESRRRGSKLSESTIEKITERLRSFFAFVKHHQKLEPQFSQCTNASMIEAYVNFLRQDRQLQSVTIARHLYAVDKALRFVYRNGPPGRVAASAALDTIKNVRGQCERTDRVRKLNEKEGIGCEKKHNVVYAEILQLCRDLVSAFEEESNPLRKARTLHDLLLVLIYLHYVPRAQEFRG